MTPRIGSVGAHEPDFGGSVGPANQKGGQVKIPSDGQEEEGLKKEGADMG